MTEKGKHTGLLGGTAPSGNPETAKDASNRSDTSELCWRRCGAVLLATVGIGLVVWVLCNASSSIDALVATPPPPVEGKPPPTPVDFRLAVAAILAHAVVAVAAIYFAYEAVRAAERMLVPRHLYTTEQNVEIIHALTGFRSPTKFATEHVKQNFDELSVLLKSAVAVVNFARGEVPPKDDDGSKRDERSRG